MMDLNEKLICQSCGMPMKVKKDFGTEFSMERNKEYCYYCYQRGKFTDEGITLQEKIDKLIKISVESLGLPEQIARKMAEAKLPELKRWKEQNEE